jgi:hypothetical protein
MRLTAFQVSSWTWVECVRWYRVFLMQAWNQASDSKAYYSLLQQVLRHRSRSSWSVKNSKTLECFEKVWDWALEECSVFGPMWNWCQPKCFTGQTMWRYNTLLDFLKPLWSFLPGYGVPDIRYLFCEILRFYSEIFHTSLWISFLKILKNLTKLGADFCIWEQNLHCLP